MLLSTFAQYGVAARIDAVGSTVTVKDVDYSFDLAHMNAPEREIQDAQHKRTAEDVGRVRKQAWTSRYASARCGRVRER